MRSVKQQIPSTKGNLAAVINYPDKETDKLTILCAGYLDTKDYKHLSGLAEELSKIGYTTVRFDPTGTWESDGDTSDYTNSQYLEDIKKVLEYMLVSGNYKNILLGGHSRGGQVSILYAARDPRISQVVGIMPSSLPVLGRKRIDWERDGVSIAERDLPSGNNEKEKRKFEVPFSHVLDRDKHNTLESVKKIKVPILLIAGELDEITPPSDIEKIFQNANELKKFIVIPGIGHDYRHNDEEIKLVNKNILENLV